MHIESAGDDVPDIAERRAAGGPERPRAEGPTAVTATYDALRAEVKTAMLLRDNLVRQAAELYFRETLARRPLALRIGTAFGTVILRPLTLRSLGQTYEKNPTWKTEAELLAKFPEVATEKESDSALFDCVVSTYWLEALARYLHEKYVLTPKLIQTLRMVQMERIRGGADFWWTWTSARLRGIAGIILGASAFVASQVPEESFTFLGIGRAYGPFRLIAAVTVISLLLYASLLWFISRPGRAWRRQDHRIDVLVGLVLAYNASMGS